MRLHEAPNRASARKEAPQTELSCTPIPPTQSVGYILSYPSYIISVRLLVSDILAYSLVHGGRIVAEYYRTGRDAASTAAIWSVTKSWTSLLIGTLVRDGRLTRQTTLGLSLIHI